MPKPLRIAFIADLHFHNHGRWGGALSSGLNRRARAVVLAIEETIALAERERCDVIVVAGDVFDVSNPTPQLVAKLLELMDRFRGHWVFLVGNHDMKSTQVGDHALGPLAHGERAIVVERPGVVRIEDQPALYAVPFRPGPATEWFPKELPRGLPVAIHLGVIDDETPVYLQKSDDAVPLEFLRDKMEEFDIPLIAAGNWHNHRGWNTASGLVVQVGTIAPKTIAESGRDDFGKVLIWQGGKFEIKEVGGPRMMSVCSLDEFDSAISEFDGLSPIELFIEYVHDGVEELADIYVRLDAAMKSQRIADYQLVEAGSSKAEIDEFVADAIAASKSEEEAVHAYVTGQIGKPGSAMTEEKSPAVIAAIRSYLAGRSIVEEEPRDSR